MSEVFDRADLDKYYTPSEIVSTVVDSLFQRMGTTGPFEIIEPSAGDGRFYPHLLRYSDNIRMYDLVPDPYFDIEEANPPEIIQADFLNLLIPNKESNKIRIFIGNPPFGKGNSLSIKFFNHCSFLGADVIAFILPDSFGSKLLFRNRISLEYSLFDKISLPHNFHFERTDGNIYSGINLLSCSFQIWIRKKRLEFPEPISFGYDIVKPRNNKTIVINEDGTSSTREQPVGDLDVDFTIVTHGTRAGSIEDFDGRTQKVSVRQFIKTKEGFSKTFIRERFERANFSYFLNSATIPGSQSSLSGSEIISVVEGYDYELKKVGLSDITIRDLLQ